MSFHVSGTLVSKLPKESGTKDGKPWERQVFIVQGHDSYGPKSYAITAWNEAIIDLRPFKQYACLTVHFAIECKGRGGKYYTELKALKLEADKPAVPPIVQRRAERMAAEAGSDRLVYDAHNDDYDKLPF